jgi:hypothetical protein
MAVDMENEAGVTRLSKLSQADRLRFVCWALQRQQLRQRFTTAAIRAGFKTARLRAPANLSALVNHLSNRGDLLRDGDAWTLESDLLRRLDQQYRDRPLTVEVHKLLADLPSRVTDATERTFLDEALTCFRAGAFRATIVMTWNLAYDHLCRFVLAHHLPAFNSQWPITFSHLNAKSRIRAVATIEHFSELKESEVIQICRSAAIITNDVYKILEDKLGRRNTAAHPSLVVITQLQTEAFVDDLVRNVVLTLT